MGKTEFLARTKKVISLEITFFVYHHILMTGQSLGIQLNMEGSDMENRDLLYDALREKTRVQLLDYPKFDIKVKAADIVKSVLYHGYMTEKNKFQWPNGLLALGLEWSHRTSDDNEDLEHLITYYDKWIEKGSPIDFVDQAINGYTLIYLYEVTKQRKYKALLDSIFQYLLDHPKEANDSIPYRTKVSSDIYIDALGMICPFLCRYGSKNNHAAAIDLGAKQIVNYIDNGMDDRTGLPYHGYNPHHNTKLGIIGWGRGVGWLLMGMVDSLEYIPEDNIHYDQIKAAFIKIVGQVVTFQNKNGHFTWQLSAVEGASDTSATSMICYAIKRGMMLGILDSVYIKNTGAALEYLHKSVESGLVTGSSAECKGFSMYPQKYAAYPWAQGPTTALAALSAVPSPEIFIAESSDEAI